MAWKLVLKLNCTIFFNTCEDDGELVACWLESLVACSPIKQCDLLQSLWRRLQICWTLTQRLYIFFSNRLFRLLQFGWRRCRILILHVELFQFEYLASSLLEFDGALSWAVALKAKAQVRKFCWDLEALIRGPFPLLELIGLWEILRLGNYNLMERPRAWFAWTRK